MSFVYKFPNPNYNNVPRLTNYNNVPRLINYNNNINELYNNNLSSPAYLNPNASYIVESHINKDLTICESTELDKLRVNLKARIDRRICELVSQLDVIRYKLLFIQKRFRFLSLCIIYLASFLTLLEGIKNSEFIVEKLNNNRNVKMMINLSPLLIRTTIALIGTIIKFYKYKEKIEAIAGAIESSLNTWTKFKTIKETISCYDISKELYKSSMENYINDAFKQFLLCKTQIDKNLNKNDRIRYVRYINKSREKDARIYEIKDFEWRTDNKEGIQE